MVGVVKNIHRWVQGFTYILLISSFQQLATAGSFAEAFKVFVLGSDANVNNTDNLLANSTRSQKCMQCHDGSSAKAIVLKNADSPSQMNGHRNVNHPVGLNYSHYANEMPASYVSLENLDARIQLENGNVTCVSCHESRDNDERQVQQSFTFAGIQDQACESTGKLTVESGRIGLCMSCHAM